MTIDQSGNVGIGTVIPDSMLEVEGGSATIHIDSTSSAILNLDKAAATRSAGINFETADSFQWQIGTSDSDIQGDD